MRKSCSSTCIRYCEDNRISHSMPNTCRSVRYDDFMATPQKINSAWMSSVSLEKRRTATCEGFSDLRRVFVKTGKVYYNGM